MITEIAFLTIEPSRADEFEEAVANAQPHFAKAQGCHGMRLERVIENPAEYRLVVSWETVEAHTEVFRNSDGFAQWRALAGPFFISPPRVEHWQAVA